VAGLWSEITHDNSSGVNDLAAMDRRCDPYNQFFWTPDAKSAMLSRQQDGITKLGTTAGPDGFDNDRKSI